MALRSTHAAVEPHITRDGSEIRELMHPSVQGNREQSLAEATVRPGGSTILHRHRLTEEIYHFTGGRGVMTLGDERFDVQAGDTICIPPGVAHCIANNGPEPLVLLCACAPPYSHDDTQLLADPE